MNIPDLKKLILRCFPGLAAYRGLQYVEIEKIHQTPGTHTRLKPVACADVALLDSDHNRVENVKTLTNVCLAASSRHVVDVPRTGDICLLAFPYWRAHTAVVLAVLYDGRAAAPKEGVYQLTGADDVDLQAEKNFSIGSGEDFFVLADVLIEKIEALFDLVLELGQIGNMGAPLGNLASVRTKWEANLKPALAEIKSNIALGKDTIIPL